MKQGDLSSQSTCPQNHGDTEIIKILHDWMDIFMNRSMSGLGQFLRGRGLSMQQFGVLMQIHIKGSCGISHLRDHSGITPPAASQLVDRLAQAGYVQRTEDQEDRRAKHLALTEKGEELVRAGMQERYRWLDEQVMSLSEEDRQHISQILRLMTGVGMQD